MEVNISEIVSAKLEQMDRDGIVQKKIEETLEKTVLDVIASELTGYTFRKSISDQVSASISEIAKDCGFSAYNGFIAERVRAIIQDMYTDDISQKVQDALSNVMLKRHENVKLSEVFQAYREWVLKNTKESEKYERQTFTCRLDVKEDGSNFTHYICTFADHPLNDKDVRSRYDRADIVLKFLVYGGKGQDTISSIFLDGRNISDTLRIGRLTEFEAFVVNLYYNRTEIILDADTVEDEQDEHFDIDC